MIQLKNVQSAYNAPLDIFNPALPEREPGLHVSEIIKAIGEDLYPKWFKKYSDELKERQVNHFTKGLVLEEAWGRSLSNMIGDGFERPEPKQEEGVWCSPDGYVGPGAPPPSHWPAEYPGFTTPAIHECKVTLKSCNEDTSPITHEKFIHWHMQVAAYCYVWRCHTAYITTLHLCGDYKARPWTPMAAVHQIDFTADQLAEFWKYLVDQAKERGLM